MRNTFDDPGTEKRPCPKFKMTRRSFRRSDHKGENVRAERQFLARMEARISAGMPVCADRLG